MEKENQIAVEIVDAAIEVHRVLGGPGLLESIYEESLGFELRLRHLFVERQKIIPVVYKGQAVSAPLRLDMLVSQLVIVECKATNEYNKIYESQLLTYLRLTGLKLGLVINFGEVLVKNGIHRVIN
jgi:GxxExxY protein